MRTFTPLAASMMLIALLSACGASRAVGPRTPSPRAPSPPTCPDLRPDVQVELDFVSPVTTHRGVRIFSAVAEGHPSLVWLREDGSLGSAKLGVDTHCTPEGTEAVRCFAGPDLRERGEPGAVYTQRVELSEAPRVGPVEVWETVPGLEYISLAATDGHRAALVYPEPRPSNARVLSRWDVERGQPTGVPVALEPGLIPVAAWCDDVCTMVAREDEFRTVTVQTPGGERHTLASKDVERVEVFSSGDARIVASHLRSGNVHLAALASDGRPVGVPHVLRLGWAGDFRPLDDGLAATRKLGQAWKLVRVSPRGRVFDRRVIADTGGLQAAWVGDGIEVAALLGEVDYTTTGDYAFHDWSFEASERFLHRHRGTEWRSILGSVPTQGDGRGGYDVQWFVRPGRAAILLESTGDAMARPRLIPVRRPCEQGE